MAAFKTRPAAGPSVVSVDYPPDCPKRIRGIAEKHVSFACAAAVASTYLLADLRQFGQVGIGFRPVLERQREPSLGARGVALVLGGAVAGGQVRGDWPGLGAGRLYEDRDLQPTTDMRAIAKGLLRDHLRLPAAAVEEAFPDSRAVAPMGGLVRA